MNSVQQAYREALKRKLMEKSARLAELQAEVEQIKVEIKEVAEEFDKLS